MCVRVVWRVAATKDLVPNYESQNLSATVAEQVMPRGTLLDGDDACGEGAEGHAAVNNWEGQQLEASQQPPLSNDDDDDDGGGGGSDPSFAAAFLLAIEAWTRRAAMPSPSPTAATPTAGT